AARWSPRARRSGSPARRAPTPASSWPPRSAWSRPGPSEPDPVGPLQLLDPAVLDGEAVAFGQGVVLRRRGLVAQHWGQLLEVALQAAWGQHLQHPGPLRPPGAPG